MCDAYFELMIEWVAYWLDEQGNQSFKEGRYDEAVECYTHAIGLDNNYPVLYANRAMALLKQEKWVALSICWRLHRVTRPLALAVCQRVAT